MALTPRRISKKPLPPDPSIVETFKTVTAGDIIKVRGVRGEFRFLSAKVNESGEPTCIYTSGPLGNAMLRQFPPDRVLVPSKKRLAMQRARKGEK